MIKEDQFFKNKNYLEQSQPQEMISTAVNKERVRESGEKITDEEKERGETQKRLNYLKAIKIEELSNRRSYSNIIEKAKGNIGKGAESLKKRAKIALVLGFLSCVDFSTALAENIVVNDVRVRRPIEYTDKNIWAKPETEEILESMEIKEQAKIFAEQIGKYKKIGYKIKFARSLDINFFVEDLKNGSDILLKELEQDTKQERKISLDYQDTPTKGLKYFSPTDFSGELNSKGDVIEVVPFAIRSKKMRPGVIMIEVYHRLPTEKPVIYSKIVTEDELSKMAREIRVVLNEKFNNSSQLQEKIDAVPVASEISAEEEPAYTLLKEKQFSAEQKRALQDVVYFGIEVTPEGMPVDLERGVVANVVSLKLSGKELEKIGSPIKINGKIQTIQMLRKIPVFQIDEEAGMINNEPRFKISVDQYGNVVQKSVELPVLKQENRETATEGFEFTLIRPPAIFGKDTKQEIERKPVDFNIGNFQFANEQALLWGRVESPIAFGGVNKEYGFFTNLNHQEVLQEFGPRFLHLYEGIKAAENLFGFKAGERLKNINIVRSNQDNAFVPVENLDTIIIFDRLIRQKNGFNVMTTAFHEGVHCLDAQLGLSDGEFKNQFEKLREAVIKSNSGLLFERINEGNFFPEGTGGHSQDNAEELLASFLNTFNIDKSGKETWNNKISAFPQEVKNQYLETLKVLRLQFEKNAEIPKDAPIFKEIQAKVKFMEQD